MACSGTDNKAENIPPEDADGDGISVEAGDCDDTDPSVGIVDLDGDGHSACSSDCDDTDATVYVGSAHLDSDYACMRDSDNDGYGDQNALAPIEAGSDCDDNDPALTGADLDLDGHSVCDGDCDDADRFTYPGSAELDSSILCMTDVDDDGWGRMGEVAGDPGLDCDDEEALMGPVDLDGDGLSGCDGDCDDGDPLINDADIDGDGVSICDGDIEDDNPAVAYVASSGPAFAYVPAGTNFQMGSPPEEIGRDWDEFQHEVNLSRGFLIMTTEVTQAQYGSLMGENPSFHPDGGGSDPERPVENVNWHDAARFANVLTQLEGLSECYFCDNSGGCAPVGNPYLCSGYRLPTEAEWEYASRSGVESSFWTPAGGADISIVPAGAADLCVDAVPLSDGTTLSTLAWYCGSSFTVTHPVAERMKNAYHLYDMLGNVEEWVHDAYGAYSQTPVYDPYENTGDSRVIRGGSYISTPGELRASSRRSLSPLAVSEQLGFRLVRSIPFSN